MFMIDDIGLGAESVDFNHRSEAEYDLSAGWKPSLEDFNFDLGVIRYGYVNQPAHVDSDTDEFKGAVFRDHAALFVGDGGGVCIGMDGKTLRGSFDGMLDERARQIWNAFAVGEKLILAHIDIDDKSNEIPAAQKLFEDLNLKDHLVTLTLFIGE